MSNKTPRLNYSKIRVERHGQLSVPHVTVSNSFRWVNGSELHENAALANAVAEQQRAFPKATIILTVKPPSAPGNPAFVTIHRQGRAPKRIQNKAFPDAGAAFAKTNSRVARMA